MSDIRKKVLYVITKSTLGGAQRYVFDLATRMPKDRFEVAVALGGEGPLKTNLQKAGVRVMSIPGLIRDVRLLQEVRVFRELLELFKREHPDVVHLNSSKIGAMGALAARMARVPRIVFTVHGWAFNEDRSMIAKCAIKGIQALTVALCHRVIVVSEHTRAQLPMRGTVVVRNGLSPLPLAARDAARAELLGDGAARHSDDLWIGTIAELHRNKGIDIALEAISDLVQAGRSLVYVVVGEGEERAELERSIAARGLSDHVHFVGHRADAARLLSAFDIFLLPSRTEALPYVLLEAGAAGLPVVATAVGGIPEIIENGISGFIVPPRDAHAIREAVARCMDSAPLRTFLGSALKKKVATSFSLTTMLEQTVKVYEE